MSEQAGISEEARELCTYIANVEGYYLGVLAVNARLARHLVAGTYNATMAPRAYVHIVRQAAVSYQTEHGSPFGRPIFSVRDRTQACEELARDFMDVVHTPAAWGDLGDRAAAVLRASGTTTF